MNAKRALFLTTAPFNRSAVVRMLRDVQACRKASVLFIAPEYELDVQMVFARPIVQGKSGPEAEAWQNEKAILDRIKEVRIINGECSKLWGLY